MKKTNFAILFFIFCYAAISLGQDNSWNSPLNHLFFKNGWVGLQPKPKEITTNFLRKYTYDHSDYIFVGKVIKQAFWLDGTGSAQIYANDLIQVTKVIKGDLKEGTIELKTRHGLVTGCFDCGNPCVVQETQGVFYCLAAEDSTKTHFTETPTNSKILKLYYDNIQGDCSVMDYNGYLGSVNFMGSGSNDNYYSPKEATKWVEKQEKAAPTSEVVVPTKTEPLKKQLSGTVNESTNSSLLSAADDHNACGNDKQRCNGR